MQLSTLRKQIPVIYQSSLFVTLPLLYIYGGGWHIAIALLLGWIYSAIFIAIVGHTMISHDFGDPPVWVENILYTMFFYCTLITPPLWAAYHIQHHKFTDTEKDPQSAKHLGWQVLLATYPVELLDLRTFVKRNKKPICQFLEKYYYYLITIPFIALLLVSPITWLTIMLVPCPIALCIGTLSAYTSHIQGEARVMNNLEMLLYGEKKDHALHHDDWTHARLYNFLNDRKNRQ